MSLRFVLWEGRGVLNESLWKLLVFVGLKKKSTYEYMLSFYSTIKPITFTSEAMQAL